MIARAAIGNPWIFSRLDRDQVPTGMLRDTMLDHLESMREFYGLERGLVLFRKYASRYLTPYGLSGELRQSLMTSETREQFTTLLDQVILGQPVV
jgi:tRNA-dihydrouridine synthase